MSIDFASAIPEKFLISQPISTSKAVLRKNLFQFQPKDASSFAPSGQKLIRIAVSSNTDFLIGKESYMKFVFTKTNGGGNDALAFPGVNALFKSVEIRALASGITLQKYDNYNRFCSIYYNHELSDAEYLHKQRYELMSNDVFGPPYDFNDVSGATSLTKNGIPIATTYAVGTDIGRGPVFATGESKTLVCRLNCSLFEHDLPLFLMKGGIEIVLELEDPSICLTTAPLAYGSVNANQVYALTNVSFMGMLVTPHSDVIDEYSAQWKSPQGLIYSIPSIRTRRTSDGGTASTVLQVFPGVRSARRMWVMVQDTLCNESTSAAVKEAWVNNCISMSLQGGISTYQARVGSYYFPYLPVENTNLASVAGGGGNESGIQSLVDAKNMFYTNSGIAQCYYNAAGTLTLSSAEYRVMYVDFRRDRGRDDILSGVDLSIVPLDFSLVRSATHAATIGANSLGLPAYYFFIEHDSFLRIASDGMTVMN